MGMLLRRHRKIRGEAPAASDAAELDFTDAAEELILEAGFELAEYDGKASGSRGNVLKADAEAWIAGKADEGAEEGDEAEAEGEE